MIKHYIFVVLELIVCKDPINILGGVFEAANNFLGEVADFSCQIPYTLTGNRQYICGQNGTWLGNLGCGKFNKTRAEKSEVIHLLLMEIK